MPWFKVDDGFPDHPKVLELQTRKGWPSALSLWTLAGAWCSKQLTDGLVPGAIVARLGCTKKDAALLVDVGLWVDVEGGYQFHDWLSRNPSRKDVETKREKTRAKVTKWRGNQGCNQVTDEVSNPAPIPSHPHLSPVVPEGAPPAVANDTVSSSHIQETWDAIRERYHQANTASPHPTRSQATAVAGRVKEIAKLHSQPFRETALALAAAALAEPKQRGVWALLDLDPYASGPGPAKVRMVMGTKGVLVPEDHFDAPHKQPLAW